MGRLIVIEKDELTEIFDERFINFKKQIVDLLSSGGEKLFTINQVAKLTGKSHAGIASLVNKGVIKTNKANLIPETELKIFLEAR
jgi:hypothetical protein